MKLDNKSNGYIDLLIRRYPVLGNIRDDIAVGYEAMVECYENGKKIIIAGNGGSAADSEHIVGELMKCFRIRRPISEELSSTLISIDNNRGKMLANTLEAALPAIALVNNTSLSTAFFNDVGSESIFAQQILGYGKSGDIFLGISTSGNSENIIQAAILAKALGLTVIGLTGHSGGILKNYADIMIQVPMEETYQIQELHLPIYHCWCMMLENHFFAR